LNIKKSNGWNKKKT